MNDYLKAALDSIREKTDFVPEIGIVLGSGLGEFARNIENAVEISYSEIKDMPLSSVEGHKGCFVLGTLSNKKVIAMQGRVHYYEGYTTTQAVMPVRIMALLGANIIILTNASGGVNPTFSGGDIMLITDHIMMVDSPLIGINDDDLGPRFPDMSQVYDLELQKLVEATAKELDIEIKKGVYVQLSGPNYETPAEVRALHMMGGDAVGMSTAIEAVALNHMGIKVVGLSCVCNKGAGLGGKLSHKEVQDCANKIGANLTRLVKLVISKI